jgi:TRAP-type uncharacterized transport system substrate-binding protein
MLQMLARPEIQSVKDLQGKRVAIVPKGSVVPALLKSLGVEIEELNISFGDGIQRMRAGEVFATACFCSLPIPAFQAVRADTGFKLLEVPYMPKFEESYLPATLTSEVYPNLLAKGAQVQTLGSNVVLVTYNWQPGGERYRKIAKFVDAFFTHFDKLRQPARHPAWRDVNLSASIRGWPRFPAAQQWLDRQAAEKPLPPKSPAVSIDVARARAAAVKAAPNDAAEQDRLFKEFLEWSKNRPKH